MKIAMIGQKGIPAIFGGVERHVHELSKRLVKAGQNVTVYSRAWYTKNKSDSVDGVEVKLVPSIHTKHLDTITHSLLSTLHAIWKGYDIIHYHGVGPSLVSWLPRILSPKTTVITTFHSIDRKHEKWGFVARMALKLGEWTACKLAHQTVTVSRTIAQYTRDVYDAETVYIPNAVPELKKTNESDVLPVFGLEPGKYIIMVSRLIPHKGAHYLVDAFRSLQAKDKLQDDLKLVIVGDGYYTSKYTEELRHCALDNPDILFTGFQTGEVLHQLMSHSKLMVHPSDKEGLPITVLEAMAYGLPVLLSDIPEHLELVDESEFLFSHGQTKSLEERLYKLLETPEEKLDAQGLYNQAKVEREYTWDKVVPEVINLYDKTLREKQSTATTVLAQN